MSVLDEIRKLDEQKNALLSKAKQEAIDLANQGIRALNELGFNYKLVQDNNSGATQQRSSRRTGIRDQVLSAIQGSAQGMNRSQLLAAMDVKGDRSGEQSVSNALAALKKSGSITATNGVYKAK
ncbi:hypothetical protein [Tsuneonella sp. HG222]